MKKLLVTSTILAGLLGQGGHALADEVVAEYVDQKTEHRLTESVQSLQKNKTSIKLQLEKLKTNNDAKVQKLNIQSQLDACDIKLDKAKKELQTEKDRVAREKQVAEAKRIAKEKEQQAVRAQAEAVKLGQPVASSVTPSYTYQSNSYPTLQCTWGVKVLAPWVGNYWGNATQWAASAAAQGFKVGQAPVAGAVIVFHDGFYGHVGYVTDVNADGSIQILEANFGGTAAAADPRGIGNYRGWFNPTGSVSYIYPKN